MSPKSQSIPCSRTTARGRPCKAWAMHGTDPPTCNVHARPHRGPGAGPPHGNQNARSHGFYSSALDAQEVADLIAYEDDLSLDDEIGCARIALRRVLQLLDSSHAARFENHTDREPITNDDYVRLMGLALQAMRTVARLLRDQRALSGAAADGITGALGTALDELGSIWGVSL